MKFNGKVPICSIHGYVKLKDNYEKIDFSTCFGCFGDLFTFFFSNNNYGPLFVSWKNIKFGSCEILAEINFEIRGSCSLVVRTADS